VRILPTSLTLVGFTVLAGLAGCGSDEPAPGGSSGASGKGPVSSAGAGPLTGASGAPVTGAAGSGNAAAGSPVVGSAGSNPGTAGSPSTSGGSPGTAGTGTTSAGSSAGGAPGVSGGGNAAGAPNPNAPDQKGKTNAKGGDMTSANTDYLKLGEMRLINNNWGSVEWACGTKSKENVFVSADKSSFGWNFDRGDCDTGNTNTKPDYPEIEFGIHPFGLGSSEATSPDFSTTTLLPKQLKDITEASVEVKNMVITLDKPSSWNINFEFWLSKQNPATTQGNAGVYAELMTFWGWEDKRWPLTGMTDQNSPICDIGCTNGLSAGSKTYDLIVQKESWGSGWKYFQFRGTGQPQTSFSGKVDVKKLIDYLVQKGGATQDMWLTRMEIGSEIDDNTKGSVKMSNVTFSVNNEKRSPVFGQ